MKCPCQSLLAVVFDKYSMKNLQTIASDLFNKIRGRFETVTIGDEKGNVTNVPEDARYFDFSFMQEGNDLGKISISLDETDGVVVVVGRDIVQNQMESVQDRWYNFLKELRIFAKKRMLPFDVRDINKSNLNKRDYKFLANNRTGEETMAESKMYGTNKTSYQRIGNARLAIKHSAPINTESATGRTQKINSIFIESPTGEKFKYPYKHLSGARAMARHVSEGGTAYDDFGKHISSLSEEISKLRKFNQYMGRSAVMAETLAGYTDIVKNRVNEVKKEIQNLQKESYYKEAVSSYVVAIVEDVPEDVKENWIDQLTIKQFNEELADVFPFVYKLVGEATKAKELGPEDLEEVAGPKDCWDSYKKDGTQAGTGKNKGKRVNKCVPEEIELEQGFEEMMGQFGESKDQVDEAYIKTSKDAIDTLGALRKIGKSIETGQGTHDGNLANMYANDVYDVISWVENNLDTNDSKYTQVMAPVIELRKKAKGMERELGSGKDARFGNKIVNTLYPLMQWIEMNGSNAKESEGDVEETPGQHKKESLEEAQTGDVYMRFKVKPPLDKNKSKPTLMAFAGFANTPGELTLDNSKMNFNVLTKKQDIVNAIKKVIGDKIFIGAEKVVVYNDGSVNPKKFPQYGEFLAWVEQFGREKVKIVDKPEGDDSEKVSVGKKRVKQKWANPKNYTDDNIETTKYFTIDNNRLMKFLQKSAPKIMQAYRPATQQFVMEPADYKVFRNWMRSPDVVSKFGETKVEIDKSKTFSQSVGKEFEQIEDDTDEGNAFANAVRQAKMNGKKKGDKVQGPDGDEITLEKEQRTPVSEYVLSYFDKETGKFPKGETAILTAVQKDYGDHYVKPVAEFIRKVEATALETRAVEVTDTRYPETEIVKQLAGLR